MNVSFSSHGWEDYLYWQDHDPKKLARINELIRDAMRNPYKGIGKPEPLRFDRAGYWSRRIDQEHRLVYKVASNTLYIAQCRNHY